MNAEKSHLRVSLIPQIASKRKPKVSLLLVNLEPNFFEPVQG